MQREARTSLDMSISEPEFIRLLEQLPQEPEALFEEASLPLEHPWAWRLRLAAGDVRIRFEPLPPRRLAALTLPRARIELDMRGLPKEARDAFLSRFRRHFQRGGG